MQKCSCYQTVIRKDAGTYARPIHLPYQNNALPLLLFYEYSIVEFSQPEDAQKAITTLSDTDLKGRPVFIREVSMKKDIAQHDNSLISIF